MSRHSRIRRDINEMANDFYAIGLLDAQTHAKITMRSSTEDDFKPVEPLSGLEIRAIREKARLSQAVFARRLHVTPSYVSKLERGEKAPAGPTLVLLDVLRRKGFEALA